MLATTSKIRFFLSKKRQNSYFRLLILAVKEVQLVKKVFWRDPYRFKVKLYDRPKRRTRPLCEVTNIFLFPAWISTDFYDKGIKKSILTIFKMLYLRKYSMKFFETASLDILGIKGSHYVAKSFGNNFNPKFQQQLPKWEKINFWKKNFYFQSCCWNFGLKLLPKLLAKL